MTMTTTTTSVYVLGRCPHKGCLYTRRNTFTGTVRSNRTQTWTTWELATPAGYGVRPANFLANTHQHARASYALTIEASDRVTAQRAADWRNFAAAMHAVGWVCPTHDVFTTTRAISGVYSADKRCNARCTSARGADCECTCAGANHGADHDHTTTV